METAKKVMLDRYSIEKLLGEQKRTKTWLSLVTGHGQSWISDVLNKNNRITPEDADRVALALDVPVKEIIAMSDPGLVQGQLNADSFRRDLSEMYLMMKKIQQAVSEIQEKEEALYNKLNTVTVQNARIKGLLDDIKAKEPGNARK